MHPCLEVPEILALICAELVDFDTLESRQKLARVARTSRLFNRAATDLFWSRLDCIEPLLNARPEDLWRFEEKEYNGPSGRKRRKFRVFARYLTEHDLDKLKLRAKRVRKLTITIRESISESLKRLSTIQAAITFPDFPVFTNLRTLEVKAADDWVKSADETQDISYLRILAGPSLRQLRFDFPLDSPENVSILTALPRKCKNVTELKLGPAMSSGPFSSVVLDRALGHWDQLQEIYGETFHSLGHLVTLSHLPRLRTLELEMGLLQDVSASGPSGGFRSLTRLKVFVLGDLEFYIQSNSRDDRDLPLILKRLSQVINPKTLERLSIGVWTQGMDPAVGLSDDPYHLDALQPFCNLHALRIWMPRATPLPPLLSLGRAIRGIRSLDLGPEPAVHISPRLGIRDLVPIARSFPKLKTLALPALDAPAHDLDPQLIDRHTELSYLNVRCSRIENPTKTAAFMSGLFPNLKTIRAVDCHEYSTRGSARAHPKAWDRDWQQVSSLLPVFGQVRAQERARTPRPTESSA